MDGYLVDDAFTPKYALDSKDNSTDDRNICVKSIYGEIDSTNTLSKKNCAISSVNHIAMHVFRINWHTLFLLSILIGIGFFSWFFIQKKEGFVLDEVCTFMFSNDAVVSFEDVRSTLLSEDIGSYIERRIDEERTGVFSADEYKRKLYIPENGSDSWLSVYVFQTLDVHPVVYYLIIHFISVITHSANLVHIGFSVNIFFLILTCLLVYRVSYRLNSNYFLAVCSVVCYGFSYGFINNVCFMRMYCLSAFELTLLFYVYQSSFMNDCLFSRKSLFRIGVIEFLALNTHYFSLIFIFIISIIICLYIKDKKDEMYRFLKWKLCTILLFFLLWPQFFLHIAVGLQRHSIVTSIATRQYLSNFYELVVSHFGGSIICFSLFLLACMCLSISFLRKYKGYGWMIKLGIVLSNSAFKGGLVIVLLVFYLLLMIISPGSAFRYVSVVMPLFSIFIVFVMYEFLSKVAERFSLPHWSLSLVMLVYVSCVSFLWVPFKKVTFLNEITPEKREFILNNQDKNAIIIDSDDCILYLDIPCNYSHRMYTHTDVSHASSFLRSNLNDGEYVIYGSKHLSDDTIERIMDDLHFSCKKIDYSTMFYNVYSSRKCH